MGGVLRALGILGLASACVRGPADEICPTAGSGDLVVTELRGEQSGGDTWGQWIELHNATGASMDLEGIAVELVSIDGGTDMHMLVRHALPVAAGDYVVLGAFADDVTRPAHVDYGFGSDFSKQFPSSGAVTVTACETQLDHVVFDNLPTMGTWSLDPATGTWCNDMSPNTDSTQLGLPGTPGAANHACP